MKRLALLVALLAPTALHAADIHVVSSGGFAAAYKSLVADWEKQTGNQATTDWGPSMGTTPQAVPQRIARGEKIDVVIMVGYALDKMVEDGKVTSADDVPLARAGIGVVVKEGTPAPDISTVAALKEVLLKAHSIAYSDSASGVYIQNEMFKKMGIEDQVKGKSHMIPATPVGEIVAKGEAEVGFQQVAELLPVPGITLAGRLPPGVQLPTVYSAGLATGSKEPEAGRALIRYLTSPAAAAILEKNGLQPPN